MFWNILKFRVIVQHSEEAAMHVKEILVANGITIYDLREAYIVSNTDNSKKGSAYVICCKSTQKVYKDFKERYNYQEIRYENFKTLI